MLNRIGITLADNSGVEKEVYASRKSAVYVELQAKCPDRLAVLATPMPSFDRDHDFVVALVHENGKTHIETLHGITPAWARDAVIPTGAAVLVANASRF